jgi:hypothetical protein
VNPTVGAATGNAPPATYWTGYLGLLLAGLSILFALSLGEPRLLHWYVIPVFLCLAIVGLDSGHLICGNVSFFSPVGLFGLFGFHFFFLAPLLNVYWDYWMNYTVMPEDWRPWLGGMAWLNLVGLLAFRIGRHLMAAKPLITVARKELQESRFFLIAMIIILTSVIAQTWVYANFGGVTSYIEVYEFGKLIHQSPFEGMGRLMMVAEAFPVVFVMIVLVALKRKPLYPSWLSIFMAFALLSVVCLYFGGLRGSRSNTIFVIFWAAMMVHLWIRPLTKGAMIVGALGILTFMYGYGLYKGVDGAEGLVDLAERRISLGELERRSEKPIDKVLLQDLGRGDVQALVLERIATGQFEPAGGRTYLAALALIVPQSLWPDRPPNKKFEGSELRFGAGSFAAGYHSWYVHGLAREAMINFGPLGVPFAFFVYGILFGSIDGFLRALRPDDPRMLLSPFLVLLSLLILVSDLDNLLWFAIKVCAIPCALVMLTSRRVARGAGERRANAATRAGSRAA